RNAARDPVRGPGARGSGLLRLADRPRAARRRRGARRPRGVDGRAVRDAVALEHDVVLRPLVPRGVEAAVEVLLVCGDPRVRVVLAVAAARAEAELAVREVPCVARLQADAVLALAVARAGD